MPSPFLDAMDVDASFVGATAFSFCLGAILLRAPYVGVKVAFDCSAVKISDRFQPATLTQRNEHVMYYYFSQLQKKIIQITHQFLTRKLDLRSRTSPAQPWSFAIRQLHFSRTPRSTHLPHITHTFIKPPLNYI